MGNQRSRQLQDGRGFIKDGSVVGDRHTQRLQYREEMKGKKLQQDIQEQLDTPADLSEHSTESLEEELKLLELDKKDIQVELRKRKKESDKA